MLWKWFRQARLKARLKTYKAYEAHCASVRRKRQRIEWNARM